MSFSKIEYLKKSDTMSVSAVERKAVRSLRILKRQEIFQRQEVGTEENKYDLNGDEIVNAVEKQAAECAALLEHLLADGEEKVTNIRIASEVREVTRRFKEGRKKQELIEKLEEESNLAQEKFYEISCHWNNILTMNDPLDIESEINVQKQKCDNLIEQKNNIIKELKSEQKAADGTFHKDLKKQLNDIKLLGERIDAQVTLMKNAYQTQLTLIEHSIEIEQTATVKNNEEKWNYLYNKRNQNERENMEKKMIMILEFSKKMDSLGDEYKEKYSTIKLKLESEIQALQNELQELKANCLINTEKIDYNYQILQRREEENILIRSQQKRRLNKIKDVINELKVKITMLNGDKITEKLKSNKDLQRLQNSIAELQIKSKHFSNINEKKYQQVWKMNREKAMNLIKNINDIDKIIHNQILEMDWAAPNMDTLKGSNLLPFKQIQTSENLNVNTDDFGEFDILSASKRNLAKRILDMIADSSGFLIEERLWPLLEKYEAVPTILCKLDNILNALNIREENDIKMLMKYFVDYAYCNECKTKQEDDEVDAVVSEKRESKLKTFDEFLYYSTNCQCGNVMEIEISNALSAIYDFTTSVKTSSPSSAKYISDVEVISRLLTEKDVSNYWNEYKKIYTSQKEKLWDNIIIGLNKYLPTLQDRHKLYEKVLHLRKQNMELKNLLRGQNTKSDHFKQKYLAPLQKEFTI